MTRLMGTCYLTFPTGLKVSFYDAILKLDNFLGKAYYFPECLLENIGKPVYHRWSSDLFGSWMQVYTLHQSFEYTSHLYHNVGCY